MRLAKLLKQRRRTMNLSANDVADRAGVGRSYYFEIEQGKRANISLLMAARLSQVLGVSLKDLAAAALKAGRAKKRVPVRGKGFMALKERISKSTTAAVRTAGAELTGALAAGRKRSPRNSDGGTRRQTKRVPPNAHAHAKATHEYAKKKNRSPRALSDSRRHKGADARK